MTSLRFTALCSLLLVASCGSSGSTEVAETAPAADFVVRDSGFSELSSFEGTFESLHLVRADGTETQNLLAGDIPLQFIGLSEVQAWLAKVHLDEGTYTGLRVRFAPDEFAAADPLGAELAVVTSGQDLTVEFDAPLAFGADSCRVELELDLDEGIRFTAGEDWVEFDPVGRVVHDGDDDLPIDEVRGVVVAASITERTVTIDAFADDAMSVELGQIQARIDDDTMLVDEDDRPLEEGAFYESLVLGRTVLEVHGELSGDGMVVADRIEIEGDRDDPDLRERVQIEGQIVKLDAEASEFVLLIRRIEQGKDLAESVLEELGGPLIVTVAYDDETVLHVPTDDGEARLYVGQSVEVEFREFVTEPFPAAEIESSDSDGCFEVEGVIESVESPDSIVVRVSEYDPWALYDDDDDDYDDDEDDDGDDYDFHDDSDSDDGPKELLVGLAGAEIVLDLNGRPVLEAASLVAGLRVKIRGCFDLVEVGEGEQVELVELFAAERVRVSPGKLIHAEVVEIDRETRGFASSSSFVVQTFGGEFPKHTGGPVDFSLADEVRFKGKADDEEAFFALFEALQDGDEPDGDEPDDDDGDDDDDEPDKDDLTGGPDKVLVVQVRGIADAENPGTIRAFEVKSQLKP